MYRCPVYIQITFQRNLSHYFLNFLNASFGSGTHLCLGAPHARLILRTLLRLCCEKVRAITVLAAEERVEHEAAFDRKLGYHSLIVKLTALAPT